MTRTNFNEIYLHIENDHTDNFHNFIWTMKVKRTASRSSMTEDKGRIILKPASLKNIDDNLSKLWRVSCEDIDLEVTLKWPQGQLMTITTRAHCFHNGL